MSSFEHLPVFNHVVIFKAIRLHMEGNPFVVHLDWLIEGKPAVYSIKKGAVACALLFYSVKIL